MKKRLKKLKYKTKAPSSGKGLKIEKKLTEIGLKIRTARTRRGLSILDLSEMCDIAAPQL